MRSFPDFHEADFDIDDYNERFKKNNVIIHAIAKDVSYNEHWGPLSIKTTIKGKEHYECNNRFYTVDETNYLIFNNGQYYSSYIYSKEETESFTLNFSASFTNAVLQSLLHAFDKNEEAVSPLSQNFEFIEKLYCNKGSVSSLVKCIYNAATIPNSDRQQLTELYYYLLENLLVQQQDLKKEIQNINATKYSTQLELYKRLHYAKDFIHSCYMNEISLDKIASVACLNPAYFLREFKKYFGVTPYQCIIMERMKAAKKLLETNLYSVTEICNAVGYADISSFSKLFKKYFLVSPEQYQLLKLKKSFFTC